MLFALRRVFVGLAVALVAMLTIVDAKGGGGRRGRSQCVPIHCAPPPAFAIPVSATAPECGSFDVESSQQMLAAGIPNPLVAVRCDPTAHPLYTEWGTYTIAVPCQINEKIFNVRLDFVDRRSGRVRGTLSARAVTPNAVIYASGRLIVTGQIVQHTVHADNGVADIAVTVNGNLRPTCRNCMAVCYEHHTGGYYAKCLDPEFHPRYREGNTYTITVPCTISVTINKVRLDFVNRDAPNHVRGTLTVFAGSDLIYSGGTLIVTGPIARQVLHSGNGVADISVTVNDDNVPTCTNIKAVCYQY